MHLRAYLHGGIGTFEHELKFLEYALQEANGVGVALRLLEKGHKVLEEVLEHLLVVWTAACGERFRVIDHDAGLLLEFGFL